jgi:two-component system phosphate regulon sensor histidine kinase PhoR
MRRDFVSNVSHELKTPLTALRGLIESIMDDAEMGQETRAKFLERMLLQTTRLNALISDLLHISRIEQPGIPLELHPIDLARAARLSIAHLEETARSRDIRILTEFDAGETVVDADEESLRQICDNLLTNAIRYTSAGGEVHVRIRRREESEQAILEVQDTGIGIESRHHERIFERFYRVDKARSREAGGTGLGLSIVKHVVSRLSGQVEVESALGEGSLFRVTLRLSPQTRSS